MEPRAKTTSSPALVAVASAAFVPRGARYRPDFHLRRPVVALAGGERSLVVRMEWKRPRVHVEVLANGGATSEEIERAIEAARGLSAADDDPTDFLKMAKSHPLLAELANDSDPRLRSTPTIFESLASAILEQLVTGFEARLSAWRLWRIAGAQVPGTDLVAAPTAQAVAKVPGWRFHEIGVGSKRAATLVQVARRGSSIERLRDGGPESFVERIQSLPGIGPWTANYAARNALAWSDAVPLGDFHAPFVISEAFGVRGLRRDDPAAADRAMLEVLEPFRPHRARVALLLESYAVQTRNRPLPRVDPHRRYPWRY